MAKSAPNRLGELLALQSIIVVPLSSTPQKDFVCHRQAVLSKSRHSNYFRRDVGTTSSSPHAHRSKSADG